MADDANSTNDDDGVDLEDLVGRVLDSRGITKERFDSLDGIPGKIEALLSGVKPSADPPAALSGENEQTILDKVGALIDEKLAVATSPKPKPLRAWLGL